MAFAAGAALPPICTDRPTKANALCTVPPGKFQIESAPVAWSLLKQGGVRTEVLTIGGSFVKFGLSTKSDLQLGFAPFVKASTKSGGDHDSLSGFGDLTVRYKRRLTGDGAKLQVGFIPFVKLPTAKHGIGNGKVESGLAVPLSLPVGSATLTLGPELDLLADGDGSGRHPALVNLANISATVAPRLTLAGELWSNFNLDPAGTIKQASADLAAAYAVSERFQLDAGANFGLTRDTSDVELYFGASARF